MPRLNRNVELFTGWIAPVLPDKGVQSLAVQVVQQRPRARPTFHLRERWTVGGTPLIGEHRRIDLRKDLT